MPEVKINRLTNANVYCEGNSLAGQVEEWTLPPIKAKNTDLKALALNFDNKIPSGFAELAGKAKFNAIYPELIGVFGNPFATKSIQVRGSLETWDSNGRLSEVPAVAFLKVRFLDAMPQIGLKQNDNPEQESDYTCTYYRLEIDGIRQIEVDTYSNIFFVKDEDVFAAYRANLGL